MKFMENMEQFNPHDPKYKKVLDLPKEEQENFVDVDGGFVRKEVLKADEGWQEEARKANEGRSIFKKIFFLDKQTALDIAQEYAKQEDSDRTDFLSIEEQITRSFTHIMKDLRPLIEQGEIPIDSIISEERSGRLPSEIMKILVGKIYKRLGINKKIEILPLSINRFNTKESGRLDETDEIFSKYIDENRLGHGVLYVTEYIDGGTTIKAAIELILKNVESARKSGKNIPLFYCFASIGGTSFERALSGRRAKFNNENFWEHLEKTAPEILHRIRFIHGREMADSHGVYSRIARSALINDIAKVIGERISKKLGI
jgi:hypothetical protein